MKTNMGLTDKMVRSSVAAVFLALVALKVITGAIAVVLVIVSGIFLLTSIFGVCPLYSLLGIRTNARHQNKQSGARSR